MLLFYTSLHRPGPIQLAIVTAGASFSSRESFTATRRTLLLNEDTQSVVAVLFPPPSCLPCWLVDGYPSSRPPSRRRHYRCTGNFLRNICSVIYIRIPACQVIIIVCIYLVYFLVNTRKTLLPSSLPTLSHPNNIHRSIQLNENENPSFSPPLRTTVIGYRTICSYPDSNEANDFVNSLKRK